MAEYKWKKVLQSLCKHKIKLKFFTASLIFYLLLFDYQLMETKLHFHCLYSRLNFNTHCITDQCSSTSHILQITLPLFHRLQI